MSVIWLKLKGETMWKQGRLDHDRNMVIVEDQSISSNLLSYDIPITGRVYGTLLNYQDEYAILEPIMKEAPYKASPKAPILYIKPINTYNCNGADVVIPKNIDRLVAGPALGVVIGRTATKVHENEAFTYIKGFIIANDVRINHESVYRPAIKEIARDGFLPIGPWIMDKESVKNPDRLFIKVYVNGELEMENHTSNLIRSISKLMSDVTEFMTLNEGDVLLTGIPGNAPLVKANDEVVIEIESIGKLSTNFIAGI